MNKFTKRIEAMNKMYKLSVNETPTLPAQPASRMIKFMTTLQEEVNEINDIVEHAVDGTPKEELITEIADLLGDVVVYCFSEAAKHGIPMEDVLNIIMDSNESKLGADGKPIINENGKFMKGPNYWKPESKIKALLESKGVTQGSW